MRYKFCCKSSLTYRAFCETFPFRTYLSPHAFGIPQWHLTTSIPSRGCLCLFCESSPPVSPIFLSLHVKRNFSSSRNRSLFNFYLKKKFTICSVPVNFPVGFIETFRVFNLSARKFEGKNYTEQGKESKSKRRNQVGG